MKKIVVLGGGTAGWVTALYIQRYWPDVSITVIEDPNRPPIIAGESGNTLFTDFLNRININKDDFIKATNATPKLGGRFIDWNGVGTEFLHVMQTDHSPWLDNWNEFLDNAPTLNITLNRIFSEKIRSIYLKTVLANDVPLHHMFHSGELLRQNKVPIGSYSPLPCNPMWHFDSRAAALWFKDIGLQRNLEVVLGEYVDAERGVDGDVTQVILKDGRRIEGDWFFDCSGFSRLLINKLLKVEQINLSENFPARSVVAWWSESNPSLTTNAFAMSHGWSWNINLRHRSGNGYIFDPDCITLDQAIDEASVRFNKKVEPVANFTYTPGISKLHWKNNVIAVGLSSGFLEPLEANGVAVIIEAMYSLLDYWDPNQSVKAHHIKTEKFNNRMFTLYNDIKDFLALHYRGKRNDSEYWKKLKNEKTIPDSLKEKLQQWEDFYYRDGAEPQCLGYSEAAWLMVLQGLDYFDVKILQQRPFVKIHETSGLEIINKSREYYKQLVDPFCTLDEWMLKTGCNANKEN